MFILTREEVENEIRSINKYMSKCSWMDFEFCRMNGGQIIVSGSIDLSLGEYAIDIEFEQPYFVSSLFLWHFDTNKPLIELVSDEEEQELITKYQVEEGCYIFKINVENYGNNQIIIIAKRINCKIINENPFGN